MTILPIDFATPLYSKSIELRDEVLRRPLNIYFTEAQLAEEWNQFHIVALDDNQELVGVLVLKPLSEAIVKMRQVAISPLLQKQGIGKKLVAYSEEFAKKKGFSTMQLSAREVAVPFYLKLDYSQFGEKYEEVSIPHFKMKKAL